MTTKRIVKYNNTKSFCWNWEYDADVEKRVIAEEAREQGQLQGAELIAKLIKSGMSLDEALEKIKSDTQKNI
ncbi:MAG: hypothetical protein FWD05_07385 [Oscillospiraceae bacterium]|nr:hypothetical protein [Oscillospiraceae bacterium]